MAVSKFSIPAKFQLHFLLLFIVSLNLFKSCISIPKQNDVLTPGIWRGTFILDDRRQLIVTKGKDEEIVRDPIPESQKTVVPVNFEVIYDAEKEFHVEFINGTERIRFDSVEHGRDIRTGNDTFIIHLTPYDAQIKGIFEYNKMSGDFIVLDKSNYSIPFQATYGQAYRFYRTPENSSYNISGKWQTIFDKDSIDQYEGIGEFVQQGNNVQGTFRTETGDYRFLSGEISGNKMSISGFDGAHLFLFEASVGTNKMQGTFYSGKNYKAEFEANRNEDFQLNNPENITKSVKDKPMIFKFENQDGIQISNLDSEYENKVKIIQIMGTWCPNCRDESEFLKNYLTEHPNQDLKVIAITFERNPDKKKAFKRIADYKAAMKLPYQVLYGGIANKDSASNAFPQVDGIRSFPTMIFLDKTNKIYKIHTGFDGPATSVYTSFKQEFEKTISELLK
ncbi:MAG: TlpA family protein disulfide reductase [Saprospiraceae bacterium]|nr:TlpA family protein disulfide reductase [Candidatus Vicinibacter affinis]